MHNRQSIKKTVAIIARLNRHLMVYMIFQCNTVNRIKFFMERFESDTGGA